jgi:hypothetical protein
MSLRSDDPSPDRPALIPALIDVAVMTYRKPESLIFTLLTLHRHCRDRIGTVWIGDDCSGNDTARLLTDPALARVLAPWQLQVFSTSRRAGWTETLVTGPMALRLLRPKHWPGFCDAMRLLRGLLRRGLRRADDIRYEHALASTRAGFVLVLHDDVEVTGDIAGLYLDRMQADPGLAIVGQLGQCWRCGHKDDCTPDQVQAGHYPSPQWPQTAPPPGFRGLCKVDRACRINEWCCMIRVAAARQLAAEQVHFGNYQGGGDVGAYWFARAWARGWRFADPFLGRWPHPWFLHGWQGHMGHSVWAEGDEGKVSYDAAAIRARLAAEYGYSLTPPPTGS